VKTTQVLSDQTICRWAPFVPWFDSTTCDLLTLKTPTICRKGAIAMAIATTITRKRSYTRRVSRDEMFRVRATSYIAGLFTLPALYVVWPIIQPLIVR
jgi:hypothetical protein